MNYYLISRVTINNTTLDAERRNVFIVDDKGETPTCSFLDVTDGAQHKVIATTDPVWLIIEDFGQVNKDLIGIGAKISSDG